MVDLAEDNNTGEFGLGVAGDDGVVEVYAWVFLNGCVILGKERWGERGFDTHASFPICGSFHISIGFVDQHGDV